MKLRRLSSAGKEQVCVTHITFVDTDEGTLRTFRIDWKDGWQYREWIELVEFRGHEILPVAADDRSPNAVFTTSNPKGELEIRYFDLPSKGHLNNWIVQADDKFPVASDKPGRPTRRALEMLTTRQRRLKESWRL